MADDNVTYIFDRPEDDQPANLAVSSPQPDAENPMDRLRDPKVHQKVLEKLRSMWKMSQREMTRFHERWRDNEMQYQAYLNAKTLEEAKKASRGAGTPPELVTLTVPYSFAAVQTIVTYLLHTFTGRKPIFQVAAHRGDVVRLSQNMETLLQYNGDHERIIRKLYQFFLDGEMYGVHVLRLTWKVEKNRRTIWKPVNPAGMFGSMQPQMQQVRETVVSFEGNDIYNIDPFRFYPDPRVPMDEVASRGEFVFWETFEGRHTLKKAEASGGVFFIDQIPEMPSQLRYALSERNRLANGENTGRYINTDSVNVEDFYHLMQGSVEIVPREWGLGDSDSYEKWLFTVANDGQIIQAEALDADHDKHPVIVGEPYSSGYGFGHTSVTDFMAPMQDMLSWMLNSHIFNVRSALNNTLVVNPQMVDMSDLKKPGPGRVIKLTPLAFGQNPANAVYQLPVQDITRTHITDMSIVQRFADMVSATTDNVRGQTQQGGRKTATEVRSSGEGSVSRLGAHAKFISAQSICPLASMMTVNYQQNMTQEVYLQILGEKAQEAPLHIAPQGIGGDYYFPVHDGTLPMDRVALLDVWREIFMAILQSPQLAQIFDAVGIFQYIADLGGAKNLSTFKVQTASNEAVARAVEAGNMVPARQAA